MNGMDYSSAPATPNNFVPPFPTARPAEPVLAPPPQADPYARPLSADAMMNAALAQLITGGAPPVQNLDPFARSHAPQDAGGRYANSHTQNYAPSSSDPMTAAAAAFDALAQGLAGSSRPEPRRPYDYHPVAPSPSHTALVAQPLLPAVQDYHPQVVRTLEDAVADMLKPMLQKWLADNMPRIIERALRVEAASGMKPPGTS
jgi:cell pole-organizing protein PopZ